jgi:hypothetical protein
MGAVVLCGTAGGEHSLTLFERVLVLSEADLERYGSNAMGAYLRRFMPPWVQAMQLFGIAVAFYASWHHVPAGIYGGIQLVVLCWANGLLRDAARRADSALNKGGVDTWRA